MVIRCTVPDPHHHIDLTDVIDVLYTHCDCQPEIIWTTLGAIRESFGHNITFDNFLAANTERDGATLVVLDACGIRVEEVN